MTPAAIGTPGDAEQFLAQVGIALRYQATAGLPLASLRSAAGPDDSKAALTRSIELTNHLLGTGIGVEVNVIAGRLSIVHRSLIPALYVLVRRGRDLKDLSGLSQAARSVYALVIQQGAVTAGDVRAHLGANATPRQDPAYDALSELQRLLLVDRGPFKVPKTGIPYLSREGYPYRAFHQAHADLVKAARMSTDAAADLWLRGYLGARESAPTPRKLASMFKLFLTPAEIQQAVRERTGRVR